MAIRFKRHWGIYNSGEVAGFDEDTERRLCEEAVAEPYLPPAATPASEPTARDPAAQQRDPRPRKR